MLGLALGDAMGAPFEGGLPERTLWRLIGTTRSGEMRWTDDTQMSIDVAESLIAHGEVVADDMASRFAASYRWSRGYGPGAARMLKKIAKGRDWQVANKSVYPEGSYGNGGAMRAPVVALFYADRPGELPDAVKTATSITHAHPLGIEGAQLVARATLLSLSDMEPQEILSAMTLVSKQAAFAERIELAAKWLGAGKLPSSRKVSAELGNGIEATKSCITAIFVALSFACSPFEEMMDFVAKCGGDADTVGAMAGAIWGARRGQGELPAGLLASLEQRSRLVELSGALYSACQASAS